MDGELYNINRGAIFNNYFLRIHSNTHLGLIIVVSYFSIIAFTLISLTEAITWVTDSKIKFYTHVPPY